MKNGLLNFFASITLLAAFGLMLYFGYMLFWPIKVIDWLDGNFITCKTQYRIGEVMRYRLHYNKYFPLEAETVVYFEDGIMFQMPSTVTNNPTGERDFVKVAFKIPEELPPGRYKLKEYIIYKVNPLRSITYTLVSNQFEVIQ